MTDIPEDARPLTTPVDHEYGDECVLTLTNGYQVRTDTYEHAPQGATYVRVLDPDGKMVGYWVYTEWAEDPMLVMGAIFGAAKGES